MDDRPDLPRPSLAPAQRIGDADREKAVRALSDHYGAGRLDHPEFEVRVEAAYRATTVDQLRVLFDDLPDPAPFRRVVRLPRPSYARPRRRQPHPATFPLVPILLVLGVIGVLVASEGRAFFVVPMLWFWFGFARRGWHPPRG